MSNKRKRRFWQIHLSTAIVITLLYGLVLWMDLHFLFRFELDGNGWDRISIFNLIIAVGHIPIAIGWGGKLDQYIARRDARKP